MNLLTTPGLGHGLLPLVQDRSHPEEAVNHAIVEMICRRHARSLETLGKRFAFIAERITLGGDHQGRRRFAGRGQS